MGAPFLLPPIEAGGNMVHCVSSYPPSTRIVFLLSTYDRSMACCWICCWRIILRQLLCAIKPAFFCLTSCKEWRPTCAVYRWTCPAPLVPAAAPSPGTAEWSQTHSAGAPACVWCRRASSVGPPFALAKSCMWTCTDIRLLRSGHTVEELIL